MSADFRILVIGGYGIFGGRLVELLEGDARLTLLIAGRSLARARAYCAGRQAPVATLIPCRFDRSSDDDDLWTTLRPGLVVDASGPFQAYGDDRYRVIERCIAHGVNYLDLADGSDFVEGVAKFDPAARAAGVFVLSGVSSFPVLTAAVVHRLAHDMAQVLDIRGGIAPSPFAKVGLNVIRAIAGYAGQPLALRRDGKAGVRHAFTDSIRFVIAVPGRVPLESRFFSFVDVPDLRALAAQWPQAQVWMGAGPVPAVLHRALVAFAWAVRLRLLPSLTWLAGTMQMVTSRVRWGEHRGGMFVQVRGLGHDGAAIEREWHLLAEGDAGPLIPCMAVAAVVHNTLAGRWPRPGARTALDDVGLPDYEAAFAGHSIYTAVRQNEPAADLPLYRRLLGDAWAALPQPIRELHTVSDAATYVGVCTVQRGRSPLAWMVASIIGFPKAGLDQPITLHMTAQADGERWTRNVAGRSFSSMQRAGRARSRALVREQFGPLAVDMALVVAPGCLGYVVRRWSLFGLPLPLWLGPASKAVESVEDGAFRFDVEIRHPLVGLVVRYAGKLARQPAQTGPRDAPANDATILEQPV